MGRDRFVFDHVWGEQAPLGEVWARWCDAGDYPLWWPQVRSVHLETPTRAVVVVRSLAPWPLRLVVTQAVVDRDSGRLAIDLAGDLVGRVDLRLEQLPGGPDPVTRLIWHQDCRLVHPVLRRLLPVPGVRAALRWNHTHMMWGAAVRRVPVRGDAV